MVENKRGITPIISVVLLLMMTVGISGLAWVWLQGMTGGIMDTTKNMTEKQIQQMLTSMEIADYSLECNATHALNVSLLVYNRGSTTIELRTILVEGTKVSAADLSLPNALQPGAMESIKILNAQTYFRGLNQTTTKSSKLVISAGQGYISKTLAISGSRCPQP